MLHHYTTSKCCNYLHLMLIPFLVYFSNFVPTVMFGIWTAVDIDIAAQGVHRPAPVATRLQSGEPEDAGGDEVGSVLRCVVGVGIGGGDTGLKNGADGGIVAYFIGDHVPAGWRLVGVFLLANASGGGGAWVLCKDEMLLNEGELLGVDVAIECGRIAYIVVVVEGEKSFFELI